MACNISLRCDVSDVAISVFMSCVLLPEFFNKETKAALYNFVVVLTYLLSVLSSNSNISKRALMLLNMFSALLLLGALTTLRRATGLLGKCNCRSEAVGGGVVAVVAATTEVTAAAVMLTTGGNVALVVCILVAVMVVVLVGAVVGGGFVDVSSEVAVGTVDVDTVVEEGTAAVDVSFTDTNFVAVVVVGGTISPVVSVELGSTFVGNSTTAVGGRAASAVVAVAVVAAAIAAAVVAAAASAVVSVTVVLFFIGSPLTETVEATVDVPPIFGIFSEVSTVEDGGVFLVDGSVVRVFALLCSVSDTAAGGCKAAVGRELEISCLTVAKPPTKESGKIFGGSVEEGVASGTFSTVVSAVVSAVVAVSAVVPVAIFSLFLFSFSSVDLSSIVGIVDDGWSRSSRVFLVVDTFCGDGG